MMICFFAIHPFRYVAEEVIYSILFQMQLSITVMKISLLLSSYGLLDLRGLRLAHPPPVPVSPVQSTS